MNFDMREKEDMNQNNLNTMIIMVQRKLSRKRDIHDYRHDCTPNDGIYHYADKYFKYKMKDKKNYK
jgi:hypothetical protein